jgi:WD40 repeat protein
MQKNKSPQAQQLRKASAVEARAALEQLTPKQRNSVVGKTFGSIFDELNAGGDAPLLKVLDILFHGQELALAHTYLKTQFINRPFEGGANNLLLKLSASRVSLKAAKTKQAVLRAYQEAFVWFEIPEGLSAVSPALSVVPNADVSDNFTQGQALDLSGKQSVEVARASALTGDVTSKSKELLDAETAQALNPTKKAIQNFGVQGSRHGTDAKDFQKEVLALDTKLARRERSDLGRQSKTIGFSEIAGISEAKSRRETEEFNKPRSVSALPTLLEWAQNASDDAPRLYAILGNAGAGKTSLAQQFVRILNGEVDHSAWSKQHEIANAPVALFIDLSDLSGVDNLAQLSLEEMLVLCLKRRDGTQIQTVAHVAPFVASARAGRLIFVFDGLDELLKNDALVLQKVFEQFIKVVERRSGVSDNASPPKIIVSCRSHYFRDVEAQHSFFTARGRSNVVNDDYRCLTLLPWGSDLIENYLATRLGSAEATQLMRLITTTYNLEELASKPVLLSMMAENLQALLRTREAGQSIVASTLYSQTVASWISRDDGKHRLNPAHKPLLMGALAAAMWNVELESWAADRLDQWLVRTLTELFPEHYYAKDMQGVQNDLRTATFIVRPDDRQFNFAHKSYSEYFLARFMIDGLDQVADGFWTLEQLRRHLPSIRLNQESKDFLKEMWLHDSQNQSERTLAKRLGVAVQLLQGPFAEATVHNSATAPRNESLRAPTVNAVLWEMLLLIKRPIVAYENKTINLRGLDFSEQRWEDLDASKAMLDLSDANLSGLYAINCKFGEVQTSERTDASLAVFRACEISGIVWGKAKRSGLIIRSASPISRREPLAGFWLMPRGQTPAYGVAFNATGTMLAIAIEDGDVRLWNVQNRRELATLKGHSAWVNRVVFNSTGTMLASSSYDETVRLWDSQNFSELAVLEGHDDGATSAVFDSTGTLLATASFAGTVRLWDVQSRNEVAIFAGHSDSVTELALNKQGSVLASASDDGTLRLWGVDERNQLAVLHGPGDMVKAVAFNAAGTLLASGLADGTVRIWSVQNQTELAVLTGHNDWVSSVAFNADGTLLVSASDDTTIRIWDVKNRRELAVWKGQTEKVTGITFNSFGTILASASEDGTVRLWEFSADLRSPSFQVIVPAPLAPFYPSWAKFDGKGNLLDWSDAAIDHWLYCERDGQIGPIESVI